MECSVFSTTTFECPQCAMTLPDWAKFCLECGKSVLDSRDATSNAEFAVLDLETTGFDARGNDRIVEVAIVHLDSELNVSAEYSSLVNPSRDLGATHIHGISGRDVADAPPFLEVADDIIRWLSGRIIVAHNARFDSDFLYAEFERLGLSLPHLALIDTLELTGMSLGNSCEDYGIVIEDAHTALGDARATAELFRAVLAEDFSDARNLADLGCHTAPPPESAWPVIEGEDTEYRRPVLEAEPQTEAVEVTPGSTICFTGDGHLSYRGHPLDRKASNALAESLGFVVKSGVSKKVDRLVAADPHSLSGKARKARDYGIPIIELQ